MPLVSVLIPSYQEEAFIVSCVESVQGFSLPEGWSLEILVIDGGSTDRTRELVEGMMAKDSRIRLMHNPGRIQSTALNLGIVAAAGEYILRLDAHSRYPSDYLETCIETKSRTDADVVGGRFVTQARGPGYQAAVVQALTSHWFGVGSSFRTDAKEGPADTVPYGFFHRSVFEKYGLFDERLIRGEDYEFNKRITTTGGQVWLNPRIRVEYFQQATIAAFLRKQFNFDAPFNAYRWYLAPYAFTPRHAVTPWFALGILIAIPLSFMWDLARTLLLAVVVAYAVMAVPASVQQAIRYRKPLHAIVLPFGFLAYHLTHGLGVLKGALNILLGRAPVDKRAPAWAIDRRPVPVAANAGRPKLVSILIPCFQEEEFIGPCLESVQKFVIPDGWQIDIVAIDGASTDGTRDVVKRMAAHDPRIRLLHNPRRSQSCALNLGITQSRADYVMRLDAHSRYPLDYLAKCIDTSERTHADNVGGGLITRVRRSGYEAAVVQALTTHWFGVGSSFRTGAREGPADTVPFGFFRRDAFEKFGLFDERLWRAQDYEFNRRIVMRGGRVWLNPRIELEYFQQPTMHRFLSKQFFSDAPYNAYMWYLAPYTFTPRHAVTAAFALGILIGVPLSFVFAPIRFLTIVALALYAALALMAAVRQAVRYGQPAHVVVLPFAFLAYHLTHGVGVLGGLIRILAGRQPVTKTAPAWTRPVGTPSIAMKG